jgi:uncharacterized phage protein gp47/JayE
MLGFDQIKEVTVEEARQELLEILEDVGFAATSWQEFSIPRALTDLGAWIWSSATALAVQLKEAGFSETATGTALTRLSESHYQNTRREAAAEVHLVTLTCEAGEGPHTIQVGGFSLTNANGYVFTNILDNVTAAGPTYPSAYPLLLPSGGTVQLMVQAEKPGIASNTSTDQLTTIVTTLSGVTATANTKQVTGRDIESDTSLRARNSLKWALLSAGLMDDTVEALARDAAPSVDRVVVDSTNPRGAGTLDVYLTGVVGDVALAEKEAVQAAIQRRIMHDPEGTALFVDDAELEPLNFAATVYHLSGYNWTDDLLPVVEAAVEEWRRTIPLGGFKYPEPNTVPLNELEHVIRRVTFGGVEPIRGVRITSPTNDIPVTEFAHVTAGTWTFSPLPVEA